MTLHPATVLGRHKNCNVTNPVDYDDYEQSECGRCLSARRTTMKQDNQPIECVIVSDLARTPCTLCMICWAKMNVYSRLVYGCDEDGRWDMQSDEEDDDEDNHHDNINEDNEKDHVNGYEDSCDDLTASLRMEQASFTRCEDVFVLLMDRVRTESSDSKVANANDILVCIKLVIELVESSKAMCCHSHVPRLN